MKKIKLVPGSCKECYFAEVKGCSVQCNLPSHHSCCNGKTCYKEVPVTNADMLRKMSNKDMAKMLGENDGCPPGFSLMPCNGKECSECWLDWLGQEAKGVQK